jgi:hypothetical protein
VSQDQESHVQLCGILILISCVRTADTKNQSLVSIDISRHQK